MIYCVPIENYPQSPLEELIYLDENGFEWRIARMHDAFYVRYFGEEYFKEKTFECDLSNGQTIRINNTNCIQFRDPGFETFCNVRDIVTIGYTDEIWEMFEELFTERFECDTTILESELIS